MLDAASQNDGGHADSSAVREESTYGSWTLDMNHSRPSGSGSLVLSLSGKSHLVLVANDSSQTFTYVNLFPHRFPHDEETVQQVKSPSLTT